MGCGNQNKTGEVRNGGAYVTHPAWGARIKTILFPALIVREINASRMGCEN